MIERIEVILGQATDSHATVFVRPNLSEFEPSWRLSGRLHGPRCLYARTLPADSPVEDQGSDPAPLAKIEVHEPCYWTPELPYLYELTLSVANGDREIASVNLLTGFKRFAVERARFWLNSRPHVLRAWRAPNVDDPDSIVWGDFRQAQLSLWCDSPSEGLLQAADTNGVMVATTQARQHPSPALLVLSADSVCFTEAPVNACLLGGTEAVVTRRFDPRIGDCMAARAACEQLQRDCAPNTDLAGYVV